MNTALDPNLKGHRLRDPDAGFCEMHAYAEGYRWAKVRQRLWNLATAKHLDITFGIVDRWLLRETVWFKVSGNRGNVREFMLYARRMLYIPPAKTLWNNL